MSRRSVILDTDIGNFSDDFYALAYLLASPEVDIKYIITSGGDTHVKARILAKFLDHCGHPSIPIGIGKPTEEAPYLCPNEQGHLFPSHEKTEHAKNNPIMKEWGQSYDLKQHNAPVYDESTSLEKFQTTLDECEQANDTVTLLVIGSSDNVAHLLDRNENALRGDNVRLVCMGGTLTEEKEYNFMLNPQDARRMLKSCPTAIVVPTDICLTGAVLKLTKCHVTGQRCTYSSLLMGDSLISLALAQVELALANFGTHTEVAAGRTDILFDAVAAFVATEAAPHLFVVDKSPRVVTDQGRLEPANDTEDDIAMQVVKGWADQVGAQGKLSPGELFQNKLIATITGAPKPKLL